MSDLLLYHNQGRGIPIGNNRLRYTPPISSAIIIGTEDEGDSSYIESCTNSAYWVIGETASGIDVRFIFKVSGNSKVKIKGRWAGTNEEILSVQVWDGTTWITLSTIPEELTDKEYIISVSDEYITNDVVQIRIYRSSGVDDKLYLDCIGMLGGSTAEEITYSPTLTNEGLDYLSNSVPSYNIIGMRIKVYHPILLERATLDVAISATYDLTIANDWDRLVTDPIATKSVVVSTGRTPDVVFDIEPNLQLLPGYYTFRWDVSITDDIDWNHDGVPVQFDHYEQTSGFWTEGAWGNSTYGCPARLIFYTV